MFVHVCVCMCVCVNDISWRLFTAVDLASDVLVACNAIAGATKPDMCVASRLQLTVYICVYACICCLRAAGKFTRIIQKNPIGL